MSNLDFTNYHDSYETIKTKYTELDILEYFYPNLVIGNKNKSPLRLDHKPSFLVYKNGRYIYWYDAKTGQNGNVFELLKLQYSLDLIGVLKLITQEMIIKNKIHSDRVNLLTVSEKKKKSEVNLGVHRRNFEQKDLAYWNQFGISLETLMFYNVYPIDLIFMYDKVIKADNLAYCYYEFKDLKTTIKIYQPFSENLKWISNVTQTEAVWEGWTQLPESGELLIWTKSRKDIMSIVETTGFPAISLQSEHVLPKIYIADQLKQRFKYNVILYDNDYDSSENWGLNFAKRLSKHLNIPYILIPDKFQAKDYSTLFSKIRQEAPSVLNDLLSVL